MTTQTHMLVCMNATLAPPSDLLVDLINTRHVPDADDTLDDHRAAGWLRDHGARRGHSDPGHLERLRRLREGLRQLALANNAVPADPATLDLASAAMSETPVQVRFGGPAEPPALVAPPGSDPAHVFAAQSISAYLAHRAGRDWPRLKACASPECTYAFIDGSRNSSRRWCEMAGCGNRAKNRSFRQRRRTPVAIEQGKAELHG